MILTLSFQLVPYLLDKTNFITLMLILFTEIFIVTFINSIPFHLFCKENGCQNATVNDAIEAVLKYTNVTVD